MKRYIKSSLMAGMLYLLIVLAGCKKDEPFSHDSSSPITIEKILPTRGSGGTSVLINGSNFTTDTSQVMVTLNGKRLKVIAVNGSQMMAVIPKKAGSGPITITIGSENAVSTDVFTYEYTRTVSTLAGSGVAGFANGQGADAMFSFNGESWYRSCGIAVDDNLNVYVADPGNHCIRKIDSLGNVTTFAGNPNSSGYADGTGTAAKFVYPYDVALDAAGNAYTVDPINWDIRKITPDGTATTIAFGNLSPWSIAVDPKTGNVCYTGNQTPANVYQISPQGATTQIISDLNYPAGMAFDTNGNLYVTINGDHVIKKYTAGNWAGTILAGDGTAGLTDGPGATARFSYPWGLAADAGNNLYVAGNGNIDPNANADQSIRYIDGSTHVVSTFAGSGTAGYLDGIGKGAAFSAPGGVAVDKNGTVYVLDKNNNRVRKIVSE